MALPQRTIDALCVVYRLTQWLKNLPISFPFENLSNEKIDELISHVEQVENIMLEAEEEG